MATATAAICAISSPPDARRLGDPSRGAARVLDQRSAVLQAPEQKAVAALLRRAGPAPVGVVAPRGSPAARRRRDRGGVPDAARALADFARAPGGLIVPLSTSAETHRTRIVALADRHRLPAGLS